MSISLHSLGLKAALLKILLGSSPAARVAIAQNGHTRAADQRVSGALLDTVREAAARFKDVAVAEGEGYTPLFGCVAGDEVGAMGLHYVNLGLVGDGELDATRPARAAIPCRCP